VAGVIRSSPCAPSCGCRCGTRRARIWGGFPLLQELLAQAELLQEAVGTLRLPL